MFNDIENTRLSNITMMDFFIWQIHVYDLKKQIFFSEEN